MRAPAHADELSARKTDNEYLDCLTALLQGDLDFHKQPTGDATHSFHAFPAKFPPQLARLFIDELTQPSEIVLDPMMGSGTTIVEAFLAERQAKGFDIDPLACLQTRVKTTPLPADELRQQSHALLSRARSALSHDRAGIERRLAGRFDSQTGKFVDYWFARETQTELQALLEQIEKVPDAGERIFLSLVFSATIITKSGGVSLAFDLAHTRPHRAKRVLDPAGKVILDNTAAVPEHRARFLTKTLKSPLDEFQRRLESNVQGLKSLPTSLPRPRVEEGDAGRLPLTDESVDLIVTSPPYASNAIDYMRSHKFALVWLGHAIDSLSSLRSTYIGADATAGFAFATLPPFTGEVLDALAALDGKKAQALRRYYSEMKRVLREMYRVLRPGKAAILVVGNSVMRGMDTKTQCCLAAIGRETGFEVPHVGVRRLDRNRRMMPVSTMKDVNSVIQQRMHEEYVIGFYKSEAGGKSSDAK
ncbi:MAG: DNA methyltransferase [Anaerolineaceae bacterium]|nr:DNA methyltransferase [Anaerolineaceae bacterium]